MTSRFTNFVRGFVFPHECVFKKGHYGDLDFVTWENVDGDAGGVTKWGVDQRSHPSTDIKNLTQAQAEDIYWRSYWLPLAADTLPSGWGEVLADIKINGGNGPKMAQRAINLTLANQPVHPLTVDGNIGPLTVAGMKLAGKKGLQQTLLYRDSRYRTLAQQPSLKKFLKGWLNRNNDLRKFIGI